jgi:hypothetical protein
VIVGKAGNNANFPGLHLRNALVPSSHLFRLILNKANIEATDIPSNDLNQFRTHAQSNAFFYPYGEDNKKEDKGASRQSS